jgi:hypothetical protein
MDLRLFSHGIWFVGIALQILLAAVLLVRWTWRSYPYFCVYALFNLFEAALTYAVFRRGLLYFYSFWICEAIGIVLGLAVVREIFTDLFSAHHALRKLASMIFSGAVAVLIVLALGVIYSQSVDARGIARAILLAAEATRIVEVGLIMFIFLFSSIFGLHWRQNVFGIALGLGMFAAVELVTVTLIGHVSTVTVQAFNLARSISFCTSLLIWVSYLLIPEQATSNLEIPKKAQLEQWNQAVMELISQ